MICVEVASFMFVSESQSIKNVSLKQYNII